MVSKTPELVYWVISLQTSRNKEVLKKVDYFYEIMLEEPKKLGIKIPTNRLKVY